MRPALSFSLLAAIALLPQPVTLGQAQPPAPAKVDLSKLGPQVGQQVTDFELRDQDGRTRNLQSIMGTRGAMLVFYRSADW